MSDLPKDDAPDAPGGTGGETARTDRWTPATDAGTEIDDSQGAKPGTRAKGTGSKGGAKRAPSGGETDKVGSPPSEAESVLTPVDAADPVEAPPPGERIAKVMARAGVASRRDAEAMILAGRVSVNGETLASPARNITEDDRVVVDGEPLPARERSRLWIFHKPRGLVTTARDPEGRQTVFEVLPEDVPRVVAVGRLDINTEGLLLLTNDGGLAKVIAHPDTGWLRRYRVRAHGDTDQAQLDRLAKGVTIDGMEYGPIEATLDRVQGDNLWLTLGLREGKNREVKRILEHLGLAVNRLIRLSFGPFQLGDLEVGLVEEVKTRVLKDQLGKTLAEQAGVDFESPVREPIAPFGDSGARKKGASDNARPARATRDAARPAPAPRVSTGGTGPGPRRSAWRADEDAPSPRPARVPRRGSDPRSAQAAAAERGRERVGSIRAGERRVVVERLAASAPEPVAEEAPRRRYAGRGPADRPPQNAGGRRDGDRPGGRPPYSEGAGRRDDRTGPRDARPPRHASSDSNGDVRQGNRRGRTDDRRDRPSGGGSTDGAPRDKGGFRDRKPGAARAKFGSGGGKPASGGFRAGSKGGSKPGSAAGPKAGGRGGAGGFRGGSKPGPGGRPPRGGR